MASKLCIFLGNVIRSTSLSTTRCPPLRAFCVGTNGDATDGEQTPAASSDAQDPSSDPFAPVKRGDPVFGRLTGTGRNALKSDILLFFESLNLTNEDIKVEYNRAYNPTGMILRFPSRSAYDSANRLCIRGGRLYKLMEAGSNEWELTEAYNGKYVVFQGIPVNASFEDVERFLHGCSFDASNIKLFQRNFPDPMKVAVIKFSSQVEAMHTIRMKKRNFCLNRVVQMHMLQ